MTVLPVGAWGPNPCHGVALYKLFFLPLNTRFPGFFRKEQCGDDGRGGDDGGDGWEIG